MIEANYIWYMGVYEVVLRYGTRGQFARTCIAQDSNGISSVDYVWGAAADLIRRHLNDTK